MVATKNISTQADARRALQVELGLPYYQVKTLTDLAVLITANQAGVWRIVGTITLTGNITIPANVTLEFHGGTLSGQTITGNLTRVSHLNAVCFIDTILSGTWAGSIDTRCFQLTSTDDREMIKAFCKFESIDIHRDINLRSWGLIPIDNSLVINGNGYKFNILVNDKGLYTGGTWGNEASPVHLFEIAYTGLINLTVQDWNIIDDKSINASGADLNVLLRYHIFSGTCKNVLFKNITHRSAGGLYKAYNYSFNTKTILFENVTGYCTDFFAEIFATNLSAQHGTIDLIQLNNCYIESPSNRHFCGSLSFQGGWVENVRLLNSTFKEAKSGNFEMFGINSLVVSNCVLNNIGVINENITSPNRHTNKIKVSNTDLVIDGLVISDVPFRFGNCDDLVFQNNRILISNNYTQVPNWVEIKNCSRVLFENIFLDQLFIPVGWHMVLMIDDSNTNVFLKNYTFRCVSLTSNNAFSIPTIPILNTGGNLINCSI